MAGRSWICSRELARSTAWARLDSNQGPTDYESAALTAELRAREEDGSAQTERFPVPYKLPVRLIVPLLASSVLLAGCGGYGGSKKSAAPAKSLGPPLKTISVTEKEFAITPNAIHLDKSGVYKFQVSNRGHVAHAFEIEGPGVENEMSHIAPGATGAITVRVTAGKSYETYCPIDDHKGKGMKGTLTVGAAGGGSQTTTGTTTTTGGYGY